MVATAVFLAISLVLRMTVAGYIPLFGANGTRVGIHGVFTIMPAILFGPWYGAIASGLGDFLGFVLRPMGGQWLWQMTIVMTIGGFVRGWVWRMLRGRSSVGTRAVVIGFTLAFIAFGTISMIQLRQNGITHGFYDDIATPSEVDISGMNPISRLVISRTQNTSNPSRFLSERIAEVAYAPLGAGALGMLLLGVDLFLSKRMEKDERYRPFLHGGSKETKKQADDGIPEKITVSTRFVSILAAPWNGSIMPLALTIIAVSLLINTANSVVLWRTITAWQGFPFVYIWLPRAVVALLNSVVNVFIAALLMGVCYRQPHMKALIE